MDTIMKTEENSDDLPLPSFSLAIVKEEIGTKSAGKTKTVIQPQTETALFKEELKTETPGPSVEYIELKFENSDVTDSKPDKLATPENVVCSGIPTETNSQRPIVVKRVSALFPCAICQSNFCSLSGLKKHQRYSHPAKLNSTVEKNCANLLLEQPDPSFKFRTNSPRLKAAVKSFGHLAAEPKRLFKCDHCCKVFMFSSYHYLQAHMKECKKLCGFCSLEFDSAEALSNHLLTCKPSFFKCKHCTGKFRRPMDLEQHITIAHADKTKLTCLLCFYHASTEAEWDAHLRKHFLFCKSRCKFCMIDITDQELFSEHLKVCSSSGPYQPHEEELKYCDFCENTFTSESNFDDHLKTCKPPNSTYICVRCGVEFCLYELYHDHNCPSQGPYQPHEEELKYCDFCENTFTSQSNFDDHLKTCKPPNSTFRCVRCGVEFCLYELYHDHNCPSRSRPVFPEFSRPSDRNFEIEITSTERSNELIEPQRSLVKSCIEPNAGVQYGEMPLKKQSLDLIAPKKILPKPVDVSQPKADSGEIPQQQQRHCKRKYPYRSQSTEHLTCSDCFVKFSDISRKNSHKCLFLPRISYNCRYCSSILVGRSDFMDHLKKCIVTNVRSKASKRKTNS